MFVLDVVGVWEVGMVVSEVGMVVSEVGMVVSEVGMVVCKVLVKCGVGVIRVSYNGMYDGALLSRVLAPSFDLLNLCTREICWTHITNNTRKHRNHKVRVLLLLSILNCDVFSKNDQRLLQLHHNGS